MEAFTLGFFVALGLQAGHTTWAILKWVFHRIQIAIHNDMVDRFNRRWL